MPRHDLDRYSRNRDRRMRSPSTDRSSTRSRRRSGSRSTRRSRSRSRRRSGSRSRKSRSHRKSSRSSSKSHHHLKKSHPVCEERSDNDEESDGSDHDRDEYGSRSKRLKRIDVSNPLSAFDVKTKTKLSHIQASDFCKDKWNTIHVMDVKSGVPL